MSVVVTVAAAGTVVVTSKVFAGLAAAAAAGMGMRLVDASEAALQSSERSLAFAAEAERALAEAEAIDVSVATEGALETVVAERCSLTMTDDRITLHVERDIRGKVTVRAHGRGVPREEVTRRAEDLLGRIRQQVAYREVVRKMKAHGFAVNQEARAEDGTVRVHIRRKK